MIVPAENHPGHALLGLTMLPPDQALTAWSAQLTADLNSRQSSGVLIHGGFVGSDFQDHGVGPIVTMLALAYASQIDSILADTNGDQRSRPIDERMAEQLADTRDDFSTSLVFELMELLENRYLPILKAWERDRRLQDDQDNEEEKPLRQPPR